MKHQLLAILAVSAACAAGTVQAQSNFYVVGSLGRSSIDIDPNAVNNYALANGLTTSSTTGGNDSFAYKAQLGYRFAPAWSIEGGYTNLGDTDYINVNDVATVGGKKDADLWNLDLVGTYALSPAWAVFGRVGAYRWQARSDLPTAAGGTVRIKESGYDFKFGAGLQYEFNKNLAIRGEYERFNEIGKTGTTGSESVGMYSIGAVLKF